MKNSQDHYSVVRHVPLGSVNLQKIDEIKPALETDLSRGKAFGEAYSKLSQSAVIEPPNPHSMVLASGLGAAGFCFLFGGSLLDSLNALLLGLILQIYLNHTSKQAFQIFIVILLAVF